MTGKPFDAAHHVREQINASALVLARTGEHLGMQVIEAGRIAGETFVAGRKILLCGNGGSAADAQHIAAEFAGRFFKERRALPAIALTTDSSNLTAIGNDYGFEKVFSRQVEALGEAGDLLIAISTSGCSPNIIAAADAAHARGMRVIALTGEAPSALADRAAVTLAVPSGYTPHIQQAHITILHVLCELVEQQLFGSA